MKIDPRPVASPVATPDTEPAPAASTPETPCEDPQSQPSASPDAEGATATQKKMELYGKLGIDPESVQTVAKTGRMDAADPVSAARIDQQIQAAQRLRNSLPTWNHNNRIMFVRNALGASENPTIDEANLHPAVRYYDQTDMAARHFISQSQTAFQKSKEALAAGDNENAQRYFTAGKALLHCAKPFIDRNRQWDQMRNSRNMNAFQVAAYNTTLAAHEAMILTVGGPVPVKIGSTEVWIPGGMEINAFRAVTNGFQFARAFGNPAFSKVLSNPMRLAGMTEEELVQISKAGGRAGLTSEEAGKLIAYAKLPIRDSLVSMAASALKANMIRNAASLGATERQGLATLLADEQTLVRTKPGDLVEQMSQLGVTIGAEDASLLIRGAYLSRYGQMHKMTWKEAVGALERMGGQDLQFANSVRGMLSENFGHSGVVEKIGTFLNQDMKFLKSASPAQLMQRFKMTPEEAAAFQAEIQTARGKVNFAGHDFAGLGYASKGKPRVNLGMSLPFKPFESPLVADSMGIHTGITTPHHNFIAKPGAPVPAVATRAEGAGDTVLAWRQARDTYAKESYDWDRILNMINDPNAAWAADPGARAWMKVMRYEARVMEKAGIDLERPQNLIDLNKL